MTELELFLGTERAREFARAALYEIGRGVLAVVAASFLVWSVLAVTYGYAALMVLVAFGFLLSVGSWLDSGP